MYYALTVLAILIFIVSTHIEKITEDSDGINKMIQDKVFKYTDNSISDDYTFNDFHLLFDEYNLNTNNFISTFSFFSNNNYDYKVIEIIPYINPEYADEFKNKQFLYYSNNLNDVLDNFSNDYLKIYDEYNKDSVINEINIQAVIINTADIYMKQFLNLHNKIKYRINSDESYRTIEE